MIQRSLYTAISLIRRFAFIVLVAFAQQVLADSGVVSSGVAKSADETCPIKVGEALPKLTLKDVNGKAFDLNKSVAQKPTILIFYRGGWCPYCNVHLGELKTVEEALKKEGYQVIALSPDLPKNLKASMDKNEVTYTLLSDSKAEAAKAFGLAFKVDAETYKKYIGYGINLEEASGEKHHILPMPAAYVLDTKGTIRFAFSSPDYTVRIDSEVLLAAAKSAAKK